MLNQLALIIALAIVSRVLAADCVLVAERLPRAAIVLAAPNPTGPVLFAAQELQRYIKALSGVSLPIVGPKTGEDKLPILLTVDPKKGASGSLHPAVVADRYLLQAWAQGITITGATPRAVLYGTYDLLERLGCGWCVPGDDSIPRRPRLCLSALEVDTAPSFQYRMMLDFPLMGTAQSLAIVDWLAKNRMNWKLWNADARWWAFPKKGDRHLY
jgi:hypothetical protein